MLLLLYGTYDSWIYASIAYSLTPVSRTHPAQQQGPCPWVQSIISFHTSQARLGLSALCGTDSYISVLFSKNPGVLKKANKQNKTKANKKKAQYLLKMLSNVCTDSVNVPLKFPACPAVQMPKDNGSVSPNIREYFLWLCSTHIVIPHTLRFRAGFEKHMPGEHFTYLLWDLSLYQMLRIRWI